MINRQITQVQQFISEFLELHDSVFIVLFAYFDESMSSIGGYEP